VGLLQPVVPPLLQAAGKILETIRYLQGNVPNSLSFGWWFCMQIAANRFSGNIRVFGERNFEELNIDEDLIPSYRKSLSRNVSEMDH